MGRGVWRIRQLQHQTQQGISAGWKMEPLAHAGTGSATECQAKVLESSSQAHGALSIRLEQIRQALSKGDGGARRIGAPKAPQMQCEAHEAVTDGKVVW